uniref:Macrophage-expressed gene 1 protein n=1 Tax=Panagrolaimus sp. PS1159 TaxID=55785 RepID=A0AC35GUU5_9BILA
MAIYLVFCYFFVIIISKINAQLSTVHACLKEAKDIPNNRLNGRTLAGIIGFGWDDLQSIRTKPVFFEEFKLCRAEPTGHYLLPDTIVAVPVLKVKLDEMANYYENFQNFKEKISNTFVGAASGEYAWLSASASFSKINKKTKENFAKYKSSLLYTKLQYDAFNLYQDSVGLLAPGFIDRIEQISYSVSQKLTYQAKYLAEMIVKDYGTHYVSSANTGAMIEQKTFIESYFAFEGNATLEGVRIAAAAKFGRFFNAFFSNHQSASVVDQQALTNITKSSFLETNGGPDINKILSDNATFNIENIVPYNFNGDWLYQVVSKRNFPNISIDLLLNIQHLIKNATETYYEKNTIHGCMDMNSPNFDFKVRNIEFLIKIFFK